MIEIDLSSQNQLNETCIETPVEKPEETHICEKSIILDIELQKAKNVILKLQKKCAEKSAQINRLKASEKRQRLAKCSLEEILHDFKAKKWISKEGQSVLNVNSF